MKNIIKHSHFSCLLIVLFFYHQLFYSMTTGPVQPGAGSPNQPAASQPAQTQPSLGTLIISSPAPAATPVAPSTSVVPPPALPPVPAKSAQGTPAAQVSPQAVAPQAPVTAPFPAPQGQNVAPAPIPAPSSQVPAAAPNVQQPPVVAGAQQGVRPPSVAVQQGIPQVVVAQPPIPTPVVQPTQAVPEPQVSLPPEATQALPGFPPPAIPAAPVAPAPTAAPKSEFEKLLEESKGQPAKPNEQVPAKEKKEKEIKHIRRKPKGGLVDFNFDNTPLVDVVRRFAEAKKLNVILPQQTAAIKQRVTFKPDHLLTLKDAEKYLYLFLDYAGYAVSPGQEYALVIKGKEAGKNPLPLYVFDTNSNLKVEDLPDSDAPVRAIYYFSNIKVGETNDSPVIKILQDILTGTTPDYIFTDPQSNGIVMTDKSRVVRSALQVLRELDLVGSRYVLTTLQLYNAGAGAVADLLKTQILATQPRGFGMEEKTPAGVGSYFSTNMKVVADDRRNTLIIWGKEAAVNRLREFVREYMDAPLETGKSVFHVYDLKYLDAETFATVLASVVQSQGIGGPEQQATAIQTGGPRRFFENVVVRAETYKPAEAAQTGGTTGQGDFEQSSTVSSTGTVYKGGNRLLVAAQPADWEQIKKLIDQLDIPQKQVILEVMICDYTRTENKSIESQVRNLERFDFRPGVGFQAANFGSDILPSPTSTIPVPLEENIVGDLLRWFPNPSQTPPPGQETITLVTPVDPGTALLSLNDPAGTGVWGILGILNTVGSAKILSHPYLVALNNTNATLQSNDIRRSQGDNSSATGGAVTVNIQDFTATLSVSLTPRISSADRLNLEVLVSIQEFSSADINNFTRNSRTLQTNVNMSSPNQVLVLGGLTRLTKGEDTSETPILGRVPLLQWFFRSTSVVTTETELGIFIRPTIVEPKIRDEMNAYTKSKILSGTKTDDTYQLGNPKDPIVRFFFGLTPPEEPIVESYMQEINIVPAPEIIKPLSPVKLEEEKMIPEAVGVVNVKD